MSSTIKIFKKEYPLTSGYRPNERPDHNGVDYGTPTGTEILAPENGYAVSATDQYGGLYIQLNVSSGYWHFVHLSSFGKTGQVKKGEAIGYSGNTGLSTGPHTHVGRFINGADVDPTPYLYETVTDPYFVAYHRCARERPDITSQYTVDTFNKWWVNYGSYEFFYSLLLCTDVTYDSLIGSMNELQLLELYNKLPVDYNIWQTTQSILDITKTLQK